MGFIIVLILVGLVLIFAEILLIPGVGIAGVLGLLSMGGSCFYAFHELGTTTGIIVTAVNAVLIVGLTIWVLRAKTWKKFTLDTNIDSKAFSLEGAKIAIGDRGKTIKATLACMLMAPTGSGKSCVNTPIDYIMADIRERDDMNMEKERKWKRDTQSKGANKDKKQRPEGIVVQCIDADITSAAFVQRMADAEGRFLYARMNEIEQLNNLSSRGNSHNVFDLLCLCFDYGNLYGQTRINAASVSEKVTVRFNYNVSTTVRKGQYFFRNVLTDGPLSRINICTIPERAIGSDMPIYGTYDERFSEELRPFIERLNAAHGLVECDEANALARKLVEECADFARLSQSRVYENLSFRANVIAFLKAMVLYVAHGEVWTPEMEDFVRWSLQYDLWCKMKFFGEAIEALEEGGIKLPTKGPQNLLDQLPEIFTREEAGLMRQRMGIRTGSVRQMLGNWTHRGYIEPYGEEMAKQDLHRQRYIKTEEYLRKHPQG